MTLEFRPPFQIDPNTPSHDQRSLAQLSETARTIGNDWQTYGEQQKQQKYRQEMLAIEKAKADREKQAYNYEYNDVIPGYGDQGGASPSSSMPNGSFGPQPQSQEQPNFSPQSGGQGYISPDQVSDPMPIDHSYHFNAWKSSGMPSTYDHPDYGGKGSSNPMSRYDQIMSMPGAKRRGEAMTMFKEQGAADAQSASAAKDRAMAAWYNQGRPSSSSGSPSKPPPGYRFLPDGSMEPIPGGPAFRKIQGEDEKQQAAIDAQNAEALAVIAKIDSALGKVNGLSAGMGAYTSMVPGSPAMDLSADIDSISSSLGLSKLMEMKASSKAGASGLGALSDREMTLLTSAIASLKQQQTPERLKESMKKIKTHYQNVLKLNQGINPFGKGGGGKIQVSNGTETLWIDPQDAAEAAKDGYQ